MEGPGLPPTPHTRRARPSCSPSPPREQQHKRSRWLWASASAEEEGMRLEMSLSPAAAAADAAGDGGKGGKDGTCASTEESLSVLQAYDVLGSGASVAEAAALAAPPDRRATLGTAAVQAEACEAATAAPTGLPAEAAVPPPQPLVSPEFLAEIAAANACLQSLRLPGGVHFSPVHPSCALLPMLERYEMPPAAVALGASYFQRLLASEKELAQKAVECGFFSWHTSESGHMESSSMHARPGDDSLLSLLCVCVYLGLKVCEGPKYALLLSNMLTVITGSRISTEEAARLEMDCLYNLDWRLGPYCCPPYRG